MEEPDAAVVVVDDTDMSESSDVIEVCEDSDTEVEFVDPILVPATSVPELVRLYRAYVPLVLILIINYTLPVIQAVSVSSVKF